MKLFVRLGALPSYSPTPLRKVAILQRHGCRFIFVVKRVAPETLGLLANRPRLPDHVMVTYEIKVGDYIRASLYVAYDVVDVVEIDVVPARRVVLHRLHGLQQVGLSLHGFWLRWPWHVLLVISCRRVLVGVAWDALHCRIYARVAVGCVVV